MGALGRNKDFWGGLMLLGIGAAAMLIARDYPFGTAFRMGPGYFPTLLGGLLAAFGAYLIFRASRGTGESIQDGWSLRALIIIPAAFVMFGALIDRAGFIPAVGALILGSAAAGPQFRLHEVALLALGLTTLCVAVFIWGLGLPYPMIAGF